MVRMVMGIGHDQWYEVINIVYGAVVPPAVRSTVICKCCNSISKIHNECRMPKVMDLYLSLGMQTCITQQDGYYNDECPV